MSIPLDWDDFKDFREQGLNYHAFTSLDAYSMAFNWFELAREYYTVKGFPKREKCKTGKKAGQYKPLSKDFVKEHVQDRQEWIRKTAQLKGFKVPNEE